MAWKKLNRVVPRLEAVGGSSPPATVEAEQDEIDIELVKPRHVGKIGTHERLLLALTKTKGNYSQAAELLGVTRQAIGQYVRNHKKDLAERINEINEASLDESEAALLRARDKGNIHAIMFHLRTKGKDRGYIERRELSGPDGGPMQVEVERRSWLEGVNVRRLSNNEMIEFRELGEVFDQKGPLALSTEGYARLQELVAKAKVPPVMIADQSDIIDAEIIEETPGE